MPTMSSTCNAFTASPFSQFVSYKPPKLTSRRRPPTRRVPEICDTEWTAIDGLLDSISGGEDGCAGAPDEPSVLDFTQQIDYSGLGTETNPPSDTILHVETPSVTGNDAESCISPQARCPSQSHDVTASWAALHSDGMCMGENEVDADVGNHSPRIMHRVGEANVDTTDETPGGDWPGDAQAAGSSSLLYPIREPQASGGMPARKEGGSGPYRIGRDGAAVPTSENHADGSVIGTSAVGVGTTTCANADLSFQQLGSEKTYPTPVSTADGQRCEIPFGDPTDSEDELPPRVKWPRRNERSGPRSAVRRQQGALLGQDEVLPRSASKRSGKRRQSTAPITLTSRHNPSHPSAGRVVKVSSNARSLWRCKNTGPRSCQRLTEMTQRQLSSGEMFMAAVIQDDRPVAALEYEQSMLLIEDRLGGAQKLDSVAILTLTLNSWLLTGMLRALCESSGSDAGRVACTPACSVVSDSGADSDTDSMGMSDALITGFGSHRSPSHDGAVSHSGGSFADGSPLSSGTDEDHDAMVVVSRPRRTWLTSEEDVLREGVGRSETWDEIGARLGRSASAVCQHWRLMQQNAEKGKRRPGLNKKRKAF